MEEQYKPSRLIKAISPHPGLVGDEQYKPSRLTKAIAPHPGLVRDEQFALIRWFPLFWAKYLEKIKMCQTWSKQLDNEGSFDTAE